MFPFMYTNPYAYVDEKNFYSINDYLFHRHFNLKKHTKQTYRSQQRAAKKRRK